MKTALLDARQGDRDPNNSSTVAYRNMLELKKHLNADLYVSARELASAKSDYDAIICGFGSTSTELEYSLKFINNNQGAALFWLVGEYEQSTFSPLFYSKRKFNIIKNFEHEIKNKMAINQYFININALIAKAPDKSDIKKKYGCVYYGRWRKDREAYFSRYLKKGVFLSTSPKNMKIFSSIGCDPSYARAMSWVDGKETLRLFSSSLYVEDIFTHTHYNCPANRYYEALKCNAPLLFQPESLPTFDKYGIDIPDWRICKTHADVIETSERLLSDSDFLKMAINYQKGWAYMALDDKKNAIEQIMLALIDGVSRYNGACA